MRNHAVVFSQKVDFEPQCASITNDLSEVAIGGGMVGAAALCQVTDIQLTVSSLMQSDIPR